MQIAVFGDYQRQKVLPLKRGERVLLQNVRVKFDKQGNLEGHIGDRSNFIVTKLAPDSEQYRQLEAK